MLKMASTPSRTGHLPLIVMAVSHGRSIFLKLSSWTHNHSYTKGPVLGGVFRVSLCDILLVTFSNEKELKDVSSEGSNNLGVVAASQGYVFTVEFILALAHVDITSAYVT